MNCYDCPRRCGIDRDKTAGACGGGKTARIAKLIDPFTFEEPCLGEQVCAVFFGGCSLRCTYCQNYKISRGARGEQVSDQALADIFDGTQNSIDLITPTHFIGAIERAVGKCKSHSYIYNTSGYETPDGVRRASTFTDVFLTDYKYADEQTGKRFSAAPDYYTVAADALELMRKIADEWTTDEQGNRILKRGLIVRHLVLPGCVDNSIAALNTIKQRVGSNTVLSLMSQFTPNGVGEPSAKLKRIEYKIVAEHALKLGFTVGYFQDFDSADKKFTPDF